MRTGDNAMDTDTGTQQMRDVLIKNHKFRANMCMQTHSLELRIEVPPSTMRCASLAAFSSCTSLASSKVAPPTMKIITNLWLLRVGASMRAEAGGQRRAEAPVEYSWWSRRQIHECKHERFDAFGFFLRGL